MSKSPVDFKAVWLCFKRRLIAAGTIAGAVVALFLVGPHLDEYRWWVWADEFHIVAGRVYETTIPEQRRVISSIKRDLERAKDVPPSRRDINDVRKINDLEEDAETAKEELQKLYDERAKFGRK